MIIGLIGAQRAKLIKVSLDPTRKPKIIITVVTKQINWFLKAFINTLIVQKIILKIPNYDIHKKYFFS